MIIRLKKVVWAKLQIYGNFDESHMVILKREKYQDTHGSLPIYQNAPLSSKFVKLPLCPKKYTLQINYKLKFTSLIYQSTLKPKLIYHNASIYIHTYFDQFIPLLFSKIHHKSN